MTELFVGSEGTLGTISEITLKLFPIYEHLTAATIKFDNINDAIEAAETILSYGINVNRIEFLDGRTVSYSTKDESIIDGAALFLV